LIPLALAALALDAGPITVEITNVRNARGRVHVALCPKSAFLSDNCPYEASAPATQGTTIVTFAAVPPGDYGAQAFHDENSNGKMDQMLGRIPKEGFGFSRDAKVHFGPPKWADAVFAHEAHAQVIRFGMRYMFGNK